MRPRVLGSLVVGALCAAAFTGPLDAQTARQAQAPNVDAIERARRERELHDRMQKRRTDHFTVSFEGPAQGTLSYRVLEALEGAYWRIGGTMSTLPSVPIPVVLYTTEQFRDITRSPAWAVAAFDGIIRVPMRGALDNPRELDRVLAHEYTHALVQSLARRNVPMWLHEGLAAALEADDLGWARERVQREGHSVPLSTLQLPFRRMSEEQAQLAYASSALAARRLLDEAGGVAVANLLRDLGQGREFSAAFAQRMRRSLAAFQAELDSAQ